MSKDPSLILIALTKIAQSYTACYASGMRIMGIDYGSKRVGIALTDEAGMMGFPLVVLPNNDTLLKAILALIAEKGVAEVVIGQSLGRDGKPNPVQAAIEELITDITLAVGIPVHLEPEHYSTQAALRLQGRNEATDAAAAAILLNSFIERSR